MSLFRMILSLPFLSILSNSSESDVLNVASWGGKGVHDCCMLPMFGSSCQDYIAFQPVLIHGSPPDFLIWGLSLFVSLSLSSGLPMSAFLRASTVPNTHLTWSPQPPSQTQCRPNLCPTPSTSVWLNHRYLVQRTSIMLCWSAQRRYCLRTSNKGSCDYGHVQNKVFFFFFSFFS